MKKRGKGKGKETQAEGEGESKGEEEERHWKMLNFINLLCNDKLIHWKYPSGS